MKTLQQKLAHVLSMHPDWQDYRIAKSCDGARKADVTAIRAGILPAIATATATAPPVKVQEAAPSGDFSLAGIFLLSKKPLDVMKGRFYGLRRGVGYKVETLCQAWGCSEESVRDHAKRHGALRYVEATPGEYISVIVHPETKQGV